MRWLLALGALGIACTAAGQEAARAAAPAPEPASNTIIRVTTVVRIWEEGGRLRVSPAEAVIKPGAALTWEVAVGDGHTVEIDFHVRGPHKGPFPRLAGNAKNPVRGRYLAAGKDRVASNANDQKDGYWKYDVVLRDAQGGDLGSLDPGVLIKNGI
jgi:plastocyanin